MEIIILTSGRNKVEISTYGARIQKLKLNEQTLLDTFTRADGKEVCTHPCSPIFGPETGTNYKLSQHGPARNSEWQICDPAGRTGGRKSNKLTLQCEINEGTYPQGIIVTQTFKLTDKAFSIETTHENRAALPVPVNFGEHFYWSTPQGFYGTKVNGHDITDSIKNDSAFAWREKNTIDIPSQPTIILEQKNLPWCNAWVMPGDKNYVCIEPVEGRPRSVFFGSLESLLQPKRSKTTRVSLTLA